MDFSDILYYDESSPSFLRWKVDRFKGKSHGQKFISAGEVAGCLNSCGYYQVNINCKSYLAHRIVYEIVSGEPLPAGNSGLLIDHLDRDKTNNQFKNLRLTTHSLNQRNKAKAANKLGTTGVRIMHIKASNHTYYTANWRGLDGKDKSKTFSILQFGLLPAFRMAVLYRGQMLQELNISGAGYADNHGK